MDGSQIKPKYEYGVTASGVPLVNFGEYSSVQNILALKAIDSRVALQRVHQLEVTDPVMDMYVMQQLSDVSNNEQPLLHQALLGAYSLLQQTTVKQKKSQSYIYTSEEGLVRATHIFDDAELFDEAWEDIEENIYVARFIGDMTQKFVINETQLNRKPIVGLYECIRQSILMRKSIHSDF